MNKKVAVQTKDWTFGGTDTVSIIAFLQDFKAARKASNVQEGAALQLFNHFLAGPVEAVIKARVALPNQAAKDQENCLTSYSTDVNVLLKGYATDYNIAVVDADIRQFRQRALSTKEYTQ